MFRKIRELFRFAETARQGSANQSSIGFADQSTTVSAQARDDALAVRNTGHDSAGITASDLSLEVEHIGSVVVATITASNLIGSERYVPVALALESLTLKAVNAVVLDLGRINYINGPMLSRLLHLHKRCKSDGIELRLCSLTPNVYEVFKITKLNKFFEIDEIRTACLSKWCAPEGFPFPSSEADWFICADWWEDWGDRAMAKACRDEGNRCRTARTTG